MQIPSFISIHAPRTGSDPYSTAEEALPQHFNPRSPHGERRAESDACKPCNPISIHAPRTGSDDYFARWKRSQNCISIHAPRTGSDRACLLVPSSVEDFNPRSPHGERQQAKRDAFVADDFNPRSPHGERR